MNPQMFCSATVLHMVLESLITHFNNSSINILTHPQMPAEKKKIIASAVLFFVYVTSICYCPTVYPTLFPVSQNLPSKYAVPKFSSQTALSAAKEKISKLPLKTFRCLKFQSKLPFLSFFPLS